MHIFICLLSQLDRDGGSVETFLIYVGRVSKSITCIRHVRRDMHHTATTEVLLK